MTKYYYTCKADMQLTAKSFNNVALLVFGKKDTKGIDAFENYFEKKVAEVNIYPQGTATSHISDSNPGICRANDKGNIIIEMFGYQGASRQKYPWIKHQGTHEFCHAFVDLLPKITAKRRASTNKNGTLYKNHMGMIRTTDAKSKELVGQCYYGKLFNETMMDIMTSMAINCFDSNQKGASVDEILKTNYKCWGNETTGYSFLTSITRLAIAAFSNSGTVNYQKLVDDGESMFKAETRMKNGEVYKTNDFLYGIVFDQLHIEREFDKFMGEGSYRDFCEYLDRLFVYSLSNQELPPEDVKPIMNFLPDFINTKMEYYRTNGIVSLEESNRIVGKFNAIWNSMQREYKAYFSDEDIKEIYRRAGR